MSNLLIRGAKVWHNGGFEVADVAVGGEQIVAVGSVGDFNPDRWSMPQVCG